MTSSSSTLQGHQILDMLEGRKGTNVVNWIYVISFIDSLGASFVAPLISGHLRSFGTSHFLIGVVSSVYAGLQLVSGPAVGSWSDQFGRKPVLLFTLIFCTVSYFVLGLAQTFPFFLLIRVFIGMMKHTQTLCELLIADLTSSDDQAVAYGRLNAAMSLGFVIGSAIGGHLAELTDGFYYVCAITSGLFMLNTLFVFLYSPALCRTDPINMKLGFWSTIKTLFNIDWLLYWDLFMLKFIFACAMTVFYSSHSIFIVEMFEASPKLVGYTVSVQGLVSIIFGIVAGKLDCFYLLNADSLSRTCCNFVLLSISFLFMGIVQNLLFYTACLALMSASGCLIKIVGMEILLERSCAEHRGSVVGAGYSVAAIARLVAPLVSGLISDRMGISVIPLLLFAISSAGVLLAAALSSKGSSSDRVKYI